MSDGACIIVECAEKYSHRSINGEAGKLYAAVVITVMRI
jgi:hypothetical protein